MVDEEEKLETIMVKMPPDFVRRMEIRRKKRGFPSRSEYIRDLIRMDLEKEDSNVNRRN
jgi:Arc/MetJ-type ribon-helix-helix transcriptional regulator